MKRMKQVFIALALILGASFFIFSPLQATADNSPIGLVINGQTITNMPTPPIIQYGSTLVPARAVFEAGLGAVVEWEEESRTVYIQYGDRHIFLLIGSHIIIVNGHLMEMPIPAQIINGNTMIPLRAVAENLGFVVDFRDRTVFIDNPSIAPDSPANTPSPTLPRDVSTMVIPPMYFPTTNIIAISPPPRLAQQVYVITASSAIPAVESSLLNDNRLIIDFPNSLTDFNGPISVPYYSPVSDIRASQFSENVSRVVFVLPDSVEFSISISEDRWHVFLIIYTDVSSDASTNNDTDVNNNDTNHVLTALNSNIRYEPGVILIPRGAGFSLKQAAHNNIYRHNQYILTLPVDASGFLGVGTLSISSSFIHSLEVGRNWQGHTQFTLTGRQILAIEIHEFNAYYLIRLMNPREKYQRIVVIDPGHGGQPGAVYNDVRAADLNLAIAGKLVRLIEECGYMTAFTTRGEDVFVSLSDRAQFANNIGDIMVTIHHNAWYNPYVSGVESFYLLNDNDNHRSLTSQEFAAIMQGRVVAHTGRNNRGHRTANFTVLRYSQIPSALIEVGFMSNPQEFAAITSEEYQWRVARAIFEGLHEAFQLYTPAR